MPFPPPQRLPPLFDIRFVSHAFVDGGVEYHFWVGCLTQDAFPNTPGHVICKKFEDFQALGEAMSMRFQSDCPELPASTFFEHTDAEFIAERAQGLERYLLSLLQLERLPRTNVLRRFLAISQLLPPEQRPASEGPLRLGSKQLPMQVIAVILGFLEPLRMLRTCSSVCRTMEHSSRNPRCWPSLRFASRCAERWVDRVFALLVPTCRHLEALVLDIRFEEPRLSVALPAGVHLPKLRKLCLCLRDVEAVNLGVEVLASVEAPGLRKVSLEGGVLTESILHALQACLLLCEDKLQELRLSWAPCSAAGMGPLRLGGDETAAVRDVLQVVPSVQKLEIGCAEWARGCGITRFLGEPIFDQAMPMPGVRPLLLDVASLGLVQSLTFDYLSHDALQSLLGLAPRCWRLQRLHISGSHRQIRDPDEALITLLSKLGEELEEFSLLVDMEAELRPFMQDQQHTRIGALPNLWQGRAALRSLVLNWSAFDDDGIGCIADHCPRLHTLLFDRMEYWSDAAVAHVAERLPELMHFRLRASTTLSDRALYSLIEVAPRFVTLELEPSYCMSRFAIKQLGARLARPGQTPQLFTGDGQRVEDDSWVTTVEELMAFAAGLDQGAREEWQQMQEFQRRSSSASLRLLKPMSDDDGPTDMLDVWQKAQHRNLGPDMELGW